MEKKEIRCFDRLSESEFDSSEDIEIHDLITLLEVKARELYNDKDAIMGSVKVSFSHGYDEPLEIEFTYDRLETEQELKERLKEEQKEKDLVKALKNAKKARDLKEYLKVRAKCLKLGIEVE